MGVVRQARVQRSAPALLGAKLAVASALLLASAARPASALDVPAFDTRVIDQAGVLSGAERSALEAKLAVYQERTNQQFAVLIVPSLEGESIEEYGIKVADKWKVGDKKRDDGLIMTIAVQDRRSRIDVGYGLEGDVTDALTSRVLNEVLPPAFREGKYAAGIDAALNVLMRAASGEEPPQANQPRRRAKTKVVGHLSPIVIPIILFVLFSLFGGGGRGRRRRGGFFIGPSIGGGWGGGGGWSGGGGWGGGGGGGGGFSGGGGGGFGGGGASGSW